MKKGSELRRCPKCGKKLFWVIPDGDVFGLPLVKHKKLNEWKHSSKYRNYFCVECYEELNK